MEIRLHGRGGQGGVTCAKILAAVFSHLGKSVQAFGDYAGERSGAPIRAYTRVSDTPIQNRNKVYQPDHLVVLDQTLLTDELVSGMVPGGTLILNTPEAPEAFAARFGAYRVATVDATRIARAHRIGSRSVVIVNTTIAGAIARVFELPLEVLEKTYAHLGLSSNLAAATEAYAAVRVAGPEKRAEATARPAYVPGRLPEVLPLDEHVSGPPTGLRTGSWRTQTPAYVTRLAPCNAHCPAGNDVVGFVQALATDGVGAAANILGQTTPFAAVCGRVCPAPCMEGCNRRTLDGAVDVRGLERWIADHQPVSRKANRIPDGRRFAVVGGGPAGLSAAYQLAAAGHQVTIYDAEAKLGGVLRTGIPTYRLPRADLDREVAGIVEMGVEVRGNQRVSREQLTALAKGHDALIVATGLQRLRAAGVPGEQLAGVEQGISFLRRVNAEDGAVKLRGHVVVLGGGNTAMDCARSALRCGAERVTVAYRRGRTEMPAILEEIEHAHDEGVEFAFQRAPVGFVGEGRVKAVQLARVELGPADASGRRSPRVTDEVEALGCDTVLLALGQAADLSLLPEGWELRDGRVYAGAAALNVFAAGDVSTNDGTVTHAIGSGRRAATLALAALGAHVEVFVRPEVAKAVKPTDIQHDHFARRAPAEHQLLSARTRATGFTEVDAGLADASDAQRCFSCGHCTQCDTCLVYCPEGIIRRKAGGYEVDVSFCKGCGICATECPRRAMEMQS